MFYISRRNVLKAGTVLLGPPSLAWPAFSAPAGWTPYRLSDSQRRSLMAALAEMDGDYDPAETMISGAVSSIGYHTALKPGTKVHPTRTSLTYAAACLYSGEPERLQRACDIIERVIALQDQNPDNKTYGIWSWYYEEPLDKMSPPDWNWADFCSVQLLAAWIDHQHRLSEPLVRSIRESILHAANSIRKRNVGPGYTNIALMGTYVSLAVGEYLGIDEFKIYGKERLRRFYDHLQSEGSFSEYNSPTYTVVAIAELSRMMMHIHDEEDRPLIETIHHRAWKHTADHFHPPTKQWAGPHSRCYSNLLRESTLAFLEQGTGNTKRLLDRDPLPLGIDHSRLEIYCPDEFHRAFFQLDSPKTVQEVFANAHSDKAITGTTYLHPRYCLGTVNRGDCWNQRRPFLAYWGDAAGPAYLQLRFLHDEYDYTSALTASCQFDGAKALSVIQFATDYGDTHPSLNKVKNATIEAADFRLRFELGGSIERLAVQPPAGSSRPFVVTDRGIRLEILPVAFQFGDDPIVWKSGGDDDKQWIDAIVWQGERKAIRFDRLERAFLAFAFRLTVLNDNPSALDPSAIRHEITNDKITLAWSLESPKPTTYSIGAMIKPERRSVLHDSVEIQTV